MKHTFLIIALVILLGWGCSSKDQQRQAHISGSITTADSIVVADSTVMAVTVTQQDSIREDTLFHKELDSSGSFSGVINFGDKGRVPLFISHNGQKIGRIGLILADKDTIEVNGVFPDLEQTLSITSREHDAMNTYQRLNRNFQRVLQVVQAGQFQGDSLEQEFDKWSKLYWQVYEDNRGTLASELAASESIRLLEGWNNEKMMHQIHQIQQEDALVGLAATYGKNYLAQAKGLEHTLAYLDTLANLTNERQKNMRIHMERIKLLYDSARVDAAQDQLEDFQQRFSDNKSAKDWAKTIGYDINYLSPGDTIPQFTFIQDGREVSRDSLLGSSYILEISQLANSLYQDQFDRTVVIHSIYKNYGLDVVTLPLDESQITVDAFFEERVKPWPVADAQTFDRDALLEKFNIRVVPTRFLIDKKGKIVRKYIGQEYKDVIKGIQTLINQEKEPTS